MSYRILLYMYYPPVYLICILITSSSRYNEAVAKQSKQTSGIWKRHEKSKNIVFRIYWLCFYFKMLLNVMWLLPVMYVITWFITHKKAETHVFHILFPENAKLRPTLQTLTPYIHVHIHVHVYPYIFMPQNL